MLSLISCSVCFQEPDVVGVKFQVLGHQLIHEVIDA